MPKFLVETKGPYQLVDFGHRHQVVQSHRPSVVEQTAFIQTRVALAQLHVLGELDVEATDEEFAKYWSESEDSALAVDSFLSAFKLDTPSEKVTQKLPAKKVVK